MSYILEALAKSQRERELGRVPTPTSEAYPESPQAERKKAGLIVGLLLAAIALGSAIYIAIALHGGSQQTLPASSAVSPAAPASVQQQPVASSGVDQTTPRREPAAPRTKPSAIETATLPSRPAKPKPAPTVTRQSSAVADEREANHQQNPLPSAAGNKPQAAAPSRPVVSDLRQELIELKQQLQQRETDSALDGQRQPSAVAQQTEKATGPATSVAARGTPPFALRPEEAPPATDQQLPADVYSRLPVRRLSVLAYSQVPQRRFVIVNSQKMTEGSRSKDGLVVEEIRKDGVIFSFEGHRFFDSP